MLWQSRDYKNYHLFHKRRKKKKSTRLNVCLISVKHPELKMLNHESQGQELQHIKHLGQSFPGKVTLEFHLKGWPGSSQLESEEASESRVLKGVHGNLEEYGVTVTWENRWHY